MKTTLIDTKGVEAFEAQAPTLGLSTDRNPEGQFVEYTTRVAFAVWCKAWGAQQSKIDELMLEYCPTEMTAEQMQIYAQSQVVSQDTNIIDKLSEMGSLAYVKRTQPEDAVARQRTLTPENVSPDSPHYDLLMCYRHTQLPTTLQRKETNGDEPQHQPLQFVYAEKGWSGRRIDGNPDGAQVPDPAEDCGADVNPEQPGD